MSLLILRVSLGIFLLQWSIAKLVVPEVAIRIGHYFYGVALSGAIVGVSGAAETILALALLFGIYRRWSYGLAAVIHTVSVVATWRQLLNPFTGHNDLYIAGLPVFAALILLFILRASDTYSVAGWREAR